jgi:hypothetical protein
MNNFQPRTFNMPLKTCVDKVGQRRQKSRGDNRIQARLGGYKNKKARISEL